MWRRTSEYVVDDLCHCGRNSIVKTSWTNLNPGRRYKACTKFREVGGCHYFSWIDSPMCSRAQQIIPGLLKRINKHDNEVVKLKDEVQKLEDVVEKLENELKKKRSRDRWMWTVLVLSWIVVYLMM
ncbi:hypothetical protein DH2020_019119 [Rehmannia glutinosa]|uniref:GRF-type domain-containing protein n=1 Tax=Rehmannia glutinosa TaxID=99300 RepID=A0ABR0WL47_REHGL